MYHAASKKNPLVHTRYPSVPDTILPIPLYTNDNQWLEKVSLIEEIGGTVNMTWSAPHTAFERGCDFKISITSLLPFFVINSLCGYHTPFDGQNQRHL